MRIINKALFIIFVIISPVNFSKGETILTEDYTVKIDGGEIVLKRGQGLKVVKIDRNTLIVSIAGNQVQIPSEKTSLGKQTERESLSIPSGLQDREMKVNGFEYNLTKLATEYHLTQYPLLHYNNLTQYDFCKLLGAFLDNEAETSGKTLDLRTNDNLDVAVTNLSDISFKDGIIILVDSLTKYEGNTEKYEIKAGIIYKNIYEISAIDIPFLLFSLNKAREWGNTSDDKKLSKGITKDIGVSPSGKLISKFTVGDGLAITIEQKPYFGSKIGEKYYTTWREDSVIYFSSMLYESILGSRKNYIDHLAYIENEKRLQQKLIDDKAKIDSILK